MNPSPELNPVFKPVLQNYYRWHAPIYDLSRWTFLFGRHTLLRQLKEHANPTRILEVGCGTGHNLSYLASLFPRAHITGIDLSENMLEIARQRLKPYTGRMELMNTCYQTPSPDGPQFDLILFSYCLSMINPHWKSILKTVSYDLKEEGRIAVVDFHASNGWFEKWMAKNHVQMRGHLLPELEKAFQPCLQTKCLAYGGLWKYFLFIGIKKRESA